MESCLAGNGGDLLPGIVRTTPPFVGRQQQLRWLDERFQEVAYGHPNVIFVAGEAGVGKTRLLIEMAGLAQQHHLKIYYGRCYEDLALPYLPFVRTLFEEVVAERHTLPPDMHRDVEVIQNFLRQGETAMTGGSGEQPVQTDQDKLQLFLAVSRVIMLLARHTPCVLVADDLHWADNPTLDLFTYLVFSLADAAMREPVPLCIMATYRPVVAFDRCGRLLARVQRETICHSLELTALDELAVCELIQHLGVRRPSRQLLTTISDVTRGNPLFIQEILYHLHQQGALQERGGFVVITTAVEDLRLPQHVHAALAARTQELSEVQQRIFTVAACLGERFSLRLLNAVSGMDEESVLDVVESGVQRHFFLCDEQGFSFAHPLIRHAVLSAISTARRQRLHRQIAQTMEQLYADRLETRLLSLTHHLIAAGPLAEARKVLRYACRAGDHAFALFAWSAAAGYYEAALRTATRFLSAQEQATLHYRAGLAYQRYHDIGPCLDHYDKAIAAYQQTEDTVGLARVLLEKTRLQCTLVAIPQSTLIDVQLLQTLLPQLAVPERRLAGEIAAVLAESYWIAKQTEQALQMGEQALCLAQALDDDTLYAYAYFALGRAQSQALQVHDSLYSWQESLRYAQRTTDTRLQCLPLAWLPALLTTLGDLAAAEATAQEALGLTQQTQNWDCHATALAHGTALAVMRGDVATAQYYVSETRRVAARSQYLWGGAQALFALAGMYAGRGEWGAAETVLASLEDPELVLTQPGAVIQVFVQVFQALLQAYTGLPPQEDVLSLAHALQPLAGNYPYTLSPYCAVIELANFAGVPAHAHACVHDIVQAAECGVLFSLGWSFLLPRVAGMAATAQGLWTQAEMYFHKAQTVATNVRAWPELGRTYLDWAHMLLAQHGPQGQQQAIALAQQACQIFAEYSMQPFLQRARRLLDEAQEQLPQEPPTPDEQRGAPRIVQDDRALQLAWRRTCFLR